MENDRPSQIDNYDTIVVIGIIVTSVSSLVYIPILFVFFSKSFTRIKVIQIQLILVSNYIFIQRFFDTRVFMSNERNADFTSLFLNNNN